MLRNTPFEKCLITVIKKGKLRLVFLVPAVTIAYRPLSPPPTFSLLTIVFRAVTFVIRLLIVR